MDPGDKEIPSDTWRAFCMLLSFYLSFKVQILPTRTKTICGNTLYATSRAARSGDGEKRKRSPSVYEAFLLEMYGSRNGNTLVRVPSEVDNLCDQRENKLIN